MDRLKRSERKRSRQLCGIVSNAAVSWQPVRVLVKTGEKGRGLASRWYPETLARRIREINRLKDRFTFAAGDGLALIEEHKDDRDVVFYIDPPYTHAARRLYTKWHIDHSRLFSTMQRCKGDVLMSYDNTVEIVELAKDMDSRHDPLR